MATSITLGLRRPLTFCRAPGAHDHRPKCVASDRWARHNMYQGAMVRYATSDGRAELNPDEAGIHAAAEAMG